MDGPDILLHGRVPFAMRKEVGGFSTGCPPITPAPCHIPTCRIPALPSHTHDLSSTARAGMEPIRTNPTGSRLPTARELLSTLRAAGGVKGPH